MYNIKDQACIRNTGLTFLFCTLECGTDHSNFGFPSSWPAIKYLRLLRISSSTNFPRYDPLIIENDTVQRRIIQLRILKFQILKVKKKSELLPEKKLNTISLISSSNQYESQKCFEVIFSVFSCCIILSSFSLTAQGDLSD